jgi:Kef-type K+ transport system membrane component KefB
VTTLASLLLGLGVLLAAARLMGEVARRFGHPAVIGEILAGVLLGPSVLGRLAPAWQAAVFPREGALAATLEGIAGVSIVVYLLVAGLETDLRAVRRLGWQTASISAGSTLLPFAAGFATALAFPGLAGVPGDVNPWAFALFFGAALAISALPVIARTLGDLGLMRHDVGTVALASAALTDLAGWLVFAVVLSLVAPRVGRGAAMTVALALVFAVALLTVARRLLDSHLSWVRRHFSRPGGTLGAVLALALLLAACTEWIGIHAVFGSFALGLALGECEHLDQAARDILRQFASSFFAPLFFASIGLRVDFISGFSPQLIAVVVVAAVVTKVVGAGAAARWAGFRWRHALAVAAALNARGGMEIILGLIAYQHLVIGEELFVALVVMALVTSLSSGPVLRRLLGAEAAA